MRSLLGALASLGGILLAAVNFFRDKRLKREGRRDLQLEQAREANKRYAKRAELDRETGDLSPSELERELRGDDS